MFSKPRIRLKPLAELCHRLATTTEAGLQDRKIWQDEAERGNAAQRRHAALIRDELAIGRSLDDALRQTGSYYPPMFRQMAIVGEQSGQLGLVYKRLARHYDQALTAKRNFYSRLGWPVMQLCLALFVVGLLIWIMGLLPGSNPRGGKGFDLLGWGWIGTPGLVKYVSVLVLLAICLLLVVEAFRSGFGWTRTLQRLTLKLPVIGDAFKTLALARFTWALHLVLDTSMDLRKALPLALHATGNEFYARRGQEVAHRIENGQSLVMALASTGVFPQELLDSIAVGEESGQLVETMRREATQYEERASTALSILAQVAGYIVWLLVAVFIIYMIIRLFTSYTSMLQDFMP